MVTSKFADDLSVVGFDLEVGNLLVTLRILLENQLVRGCEPDRNPRAPLGSNASAQLLARFNRSRYSKAVISKAICNTRLAADDFVTCKKG